MDSIPLSLLNDYLYCPRRAALKAIEGWWGENEHTVLRRRQVRSQNRKGFEEPLHKVLISESIAGLRRSIE